MTAVLIIIGGAVAGVLGGVVLFIAVEIWDTYMPIRRARLRRAQEAVARGKGWAV